MLRVCRLYGCFSLYALRIQGRHVGVWSTEPLCMCMYYYRARLANWLAPTGPMWVETFSYLHSGTYVNQWMVRGAMCMSCLPSYTVHFTTHHTPFTIHYYTILNAGAGFKEIHSRIVASSKLPHRA
ncbi:hypothetical protein EON63_02720 [archaeon]|nr:MAG: hypothetical protein EON63_02720 [archaeon]